MGVPRVPPHHPDLTGVLPYHPDLAGGTLATPTIQNYLYNSPLNTLPTLLGRRTIQAWPGGYPGYPPPSRPDWGTPLPSRPGLGTPPHHQDLAGVPPPSRPGWGTLHHPDQTRVPPPTIQTWLGTPPRCELINKLKTVPSPILRMQAVKIQHSTLWKN